MMSEHDAQEINEAVQLAWRKGWQIDDVTAKRIAQVIEPGTGPLHEFARTGAMAPDMAAALQAAGEGVSGPQRIWIAALGQYCQHRQRKGALPHWGKESQR
jgi:hypothetical protein